MLLASKCKKKKLGLGTFSTFLALIIFSTVTHADRVVLDFYDDYISQGVVHLKRQIKSRRSWLNLRDYRLNYVEVTAHGRGRVKLFVNGYQTDGARVRARYRAKRYVLQHHGDSRGRWELEISGGAKVSYINVNFSPRRAHVQPSQGSGAAAPPPQPSPAVQSGGWKLQTYCNCRTNKRCYIRHRNGQREVGTCVYDCPNGCKQ